MIFEGHGKNGDALAHMELRNLLRWCFFGISKCVELQHLDFTYNLNSGRRYHHHEPSSLEFKSKVVGGVGLEPTA